MSQKKMQVRLMAAIACSTILIWGCARSSDASESSPDGAAPGSPSIPNPKPGEPPKPAGNLPECYAVHLLSVARQHVKSKYHNRSHSMGHCAQAVREDLNLADIDQGAYGDAINYHQRPNGKPGALALMGYINLIGTYPTAAQAPTGAVLVFSGPYTDQYLKTGVVPPPGKRHGHPVGDWVGHITVKGDFKHGDEWYYTDGRTLAPAVRNRTLAGVYMMDRCKNCGGGLKNQCGDSQ